MKKASALRLKIEGYIKDGDIYEDRNFSALVPYYINKARHNIMTAKILHNISESSQVKHSISIPDDYTAFDWVIIAGYYAMFHMATALLGILGVRARSHESLINALEYQFVQKQDLLETDFINKMSEAKSLEEQYINRMWTAKSKRTLAHYKAEREISKRDAKKILEYSNTFIDRLHEIILQFKEK